MKKRLILLVLLAGILSVSTNSFSAGKWGLDGIGIYGNFAGENSDPGGGLGLSLKFGNFPVLGIEWSFQNGGKNVLAVSGDWWFWNDALGSNFYLYTGVGLWGAMILYDDLIYGDFAVRLVLGLQFFPIKPIELFLEFDPMLTFLQGNTFTLGFGWALRLGFRWRF